MYVCMYKYMCIHIYIYIYIYIHIYQCIGDSKRKRVTIHANLSMNKVLDNDHNGYVNDLEYKSNGYNSNGKDKSNGNSNGKDKSNGSNSNGKDVRKSKKEKDIKINSYQDIKLNPDDNSLLLRHESLHTVDGGGRGAERMIEASGSKNYYV
jgi:hypothetical protein